MLVAVVGINILTGNTVIETTQKVNVYRCFRSGKQRLGSCVTINLSGMRQDRPLARRTQKDVVTKPTDEGRNGNGKLVIPSVIRSVHLPSLF